MDDNNKLNLLTLFNFIQINRSENNIFFDVNMVIDFLDFLCLQKVNILSNIFLMSKFYQEIFTFMVQYPNEAVLKPIKHRIENNLPLIWFPDPRISSSSDNGYVLGDFYDLSCIIEKDSTVYDSSGKKFLPTICTQIRVLCDFYDATPVSSKDYQYNHQTIVTVHNLARCRCCKYCQAVEGLFGTAGQPKSPSTLNSLIIPSSADNSRSLLCTCEDSEIGKLFSHLPGLIRKSPSLLDMLYLVRLHVQSYNDLRKSAEASKLDVYSYLNKETNESQLSNQQNKIIKEIKETFEVISRNIWKCFHIDNCLHPYSPSALRESRNMFHNDKLLPVYNQAKFISLSDVMEEISNGHRVLVIDDENLFDIFKIHFEEIRGFILIDGILTEKEVNTSFYTDLDADTPTPSPTDGDNDLTAGAVNSNHSCDSSKIKEYYNVEAYESKSIELLSQPSHIFLQYVNNIPGKTFFPPKNLKALFRFLNIDVLSDKINNDVSIVGKNYKSSGQIISKYVNCMNLLLLLLQSLLNTKYSHIYQYIIDLYKREKLRYLSHLFSLRIVECQEICKKLTLNMEKPKVGLDISNVSVINDNIEDSQSISLPYHFDKINQVLYMNKDSSIMTSERLHYLCLSLLMSATRIEVAVEMKNQQLDAISDMENILLKAIKVKSFNLDQVTSLMQYEKLTEPNDDERWYVDGNVDNSIEIMSQDIDESNTVEPANDLIQAYDNLKLRIEDNNLNKSKNKVVKNSAVVDTEYEMFLLKKRKEDEELVQKIKSNYDVSVDTMTVNVNNSIHEHISVEINNLEVNSPQLIYPKNVKYSNKIVDDSNEDPSYHLKLLTEYSSRDVFDGKLISDSVSRDDLGLECISRDGDGITHTDLESLSISKYVDSQASEQLKKFLGIGVSRNAVHNNHQSTKSVKVLDIHCDDIFTALETMTDISMDNDESAILDNRETNLNIFLSNSTLSGRLGEGLAFQKLKSMCFDDNGKKLNIVWVNEKEERGFPYDITIQNEDSVVVKYCEVKTRVVDINSTDKSLVEDLSLPNKSLKTVSQWFISPSEVTEALKCGQQYFIVCICFLRENNELLKHEMRVIGLECGLSAALAYKDASLLVQVNSRFDS